MYWNDIDFNDAMKWSDGCFMCKVPVSLSVCVLCDLFTHSEIHPSKQHILATSFILDKRVGTYLFTHSAEQVKFLSRAYLRE